MPTPAPKSGESQDEFVGRCMSALAGEFPDEDQRLAVCFSEWRGGRKSKNAKRPSHRVDFEGDEAIVRDLELFAAFTPGIDSDDDERMAGIDAKEIRRIVDKTLKHMSKGQFPMAILRHNDQRNGQDRPVLGRISRLDEREIGGVPGIVGDMRMSAEVFRELIETNRFPRRSAEVWPDGFLSEVALLGSETPARPLPDTRFGRAEVEERPEGVMRFSRTFAQPTDTPAHPGATNTNIPSTDKGKTMPHDDDDLKAKLKAANDEIEDLKAKLKAKNQEGDDEKDEDDEKGDGKKSKSKNTRQSQAEQFKRQRDEALAEVQSARDELKREKYARQLDNLRSEGYQLDEDVLDRVVKADDPDEEVQFFKRLSNRVPVNQAPLPHEGLRLANGSRTVDEKTAKACHQRAMARAHDHAGGDEGKTKELYSQFYQEEIDAA